jgi:integrase
MPKRTRKMSRKQQARQDARPFAHRTGRWAKKCRGKFVYLGSIADDPTGEEAWLKWLDIRDEVRAGRTPRPKVEGLTIRDLANHWLTSKQALLDSGELAGRTMVNYRNLTDLIVPVLGPDRLVEDLAPEDFRKLRSAMAKRWGPVRMNITITYVRGIFNHALENRLIEKPVWFGTEFERPTAKTLRKARNENGPRMFTPKQLRSMLEAANPVQKVVVLLATNTAMGNSDLARLPVSAIDLENGWVHFARGKTGIDRKIPLWPETIAAIKKWLAVRPRAKPGSAKFLLISRQGRAYPGDRGSMFVGRLFQLTAKAAKVEGRSLYDARRTFQTVAEESRDLAAVQAIMGHAARSDDMSAIYRQRVSDDRLRVVVGVVHDWLFSAGTSNEAG